MFTFLVFICTITEFSLPDIVLNGTGDRCPHMSDPSGRDPSFLGRIFRNISTGCRKYTDKKPLEHKKRRTLFDLILQKPGIDIQTMTGITGFNANTMRYHLSILEQSHLIQSVQEGGTLHFFENKGRYSVSEQKKLSIQYSPTYTRILTVLSQTPGLSRMGLAECLGIAGSSVTKSIQTLIREELVTANKDGKFTRYYLTNPSCIRSDVSSSKTDHSIVWDTKRGNHA